MTTIRERIDRWAKDNDVTLVFFDPPEYFDDAILGIADAAAHDPVVLYDQAKVLAAMTADMGAEDAEEWFDFNTRVAYVGPATPRFLTRPWEPENDETETDDVQAP